MQKPMRRGRPKRSKAGLCLELRILRVLLQVNDGKVPFAQRLQRTLPDAANSYARAHTRACTETLRHADADKDADADAQTRMNP